MAFNEYKFFELEWTPDVILDVGSYLDVKTFHQAAAVQLMPFQNLKREINVELRNAPMSYVRPSKNNTALGINNIMYAGVMAAKVIIDEQQHTVVRAYEAGANNGCCPWYQASSVDKSFSYLVNMITLAQLLAGLRVNLKLVDPVFDEENVLYDLHCFMFTSFIARMNLSVLQDHLIYTSYSRDTYMFKPSFNYSSSTSYNDLYYSFNDINDSVGYYRSDLFDYYSNGQVTNNGYLYTKYEAGQTAKNSLPWISNINYGCFALKEIDLSFMSKYPERFSNLNLLGRGLPWLKDVTLPEDMSFVTSAEGLFYYCVNLEIELINKEFKFPLSYFGSPWRKLKLENVSFTSNNACVACFNTGTSNSQGEKARVLHYLPDTSNYKRISSVPDELYPEYSFKNVTLCCESISNCFYFDTVEEIYFDIKVPNLKSTLSNSLKFYSVNGIYINVTLPEGANVLKVDSYFNALSKTITINTPIITSANTTATVSMSYITACNLFAKHPKIGDVSQDKVVYTGTSSTYNHYL